MSIKSRCNSPPLMVVCFQVTLPLFSIFDDQKPNSDCLESHLLLHAMCHTMQAALQVGPDRSCPHCCCVWWPAAKCSQEVEEKTQLIPSFLRCEEWVIRTPPPSLLLLPSDIPHHCFSLLTSVTVTPRIPYCHSSSSCHFPPHIPPGGLLPPSSHPLSLPPLHISHLSLLPPHIILLPPYSP